jgi:hypothetical protein
MISNQTCSPIFIFGGWRLDPGIAYSAEAAASAAKAGRRDDKKEKKS